MTIKLDTFVKKSRSRQRGLIVSASYVRNTCPHRAFRSLASFLIYDADKLEIILAKQPVQ